MNGPRGSQPRLAPATGFWGAKARGIRGLRVANTERRGERPRSQRPPGCRRVENQPCTRFREHRPLVLTQEPVARQGLNRNLTEVEGVGVSVLLTEHEHTSRESFRRSVQLIEVFRRHPPIECRGAIHHERACRLPRALSGDNARISDRPVECAWVWVALWQYTPKVITGSRTTGGSRRIPSGCRRDILPKKSTPCKDSPVFSRRPV